MSQTGVVPGSGPDTLAKAPRVPVRLIPDLIPVAG